MKDNSKEEPVLVTEPEVYCGKCDADFLHRPKVLLHEKNGEHSGVCPECGQRYKMLPGGGR